MQGRVVDGQTGAPLEGAAVIYLDANGYPKGTLSNDQGRFVLNVAPPITVLVSLVGYERTTFPVSSQDAGDLRLFPADWTTLPEHTVTARRPRRGLWALLGFGLAFGLGKLQRRQRR